MAEARKHGDGIPECFAKNDERGGSYSNADERIKRHRGGKAQGLAQHLVVLAASVACEVGNVQRHRSPKAHYAGERRNEEAEKFLEAVKFRRCREHGAEAARFSFGPQKKGETDEQEEWRGNALQKADGLDAAQDDENI